MEAGVAAASLWHFDGDASRPIPRRIGPIQATLGPEPDLIVVNGNVYTVDDGQSRAQAFAVKHGRFVAVGSNSDIRNLATRNTAVVDAEGMTVTPGFIDAHCHPSGVNELIGVNVNLDTDLVFHLTQARNHPVCHDL
jgi:predicted amidohydrolase YtcJ